MRWHVDGIYGEKTGWSVCSVVVMLCGAKDNDASGLVFSTTLEEPSTHGLVCPGLAVNDMVAFTRAPHGFRCATRRRLRVSLNLLF